jgi:uncharacterized membrane protein HdeD (DUF308 family)
MYGPFDVMIGATPEMIHNWGWFLAFGIVLVILGIVAIARSFITTVASMMFFGWLLMVAAIIEFVYAFMVGKWAGFFVHLLVALVFGITGALMVCKPVISAEAITIVMASFLIAVGLYQFLACMWVSNLPGSGWGAANGIISAIMGMLLLAQWPASGLWVVGLFIGIDLIVYGAAWVATALELHRM